MRESVLVIIPARGGSKGIPRKNLRALNGRPLIYYSIKTALSAKLVSDVYVSTDDEEIASISRKLGVKVITREAKHALDDVTLDPVIYDACQRIEQREGKVYDLVATIQPTSPLLRSRSLDAAIAEILSETSIDTLISAKKEAYLSWKNVDGAYKANYVARLNRQYLEPIYKETGGFLITRRAFVSENSRIGKNVGISILSHGEDIDIDDYQDWCLCEYYLRRKKVLFVVSGSSEIGLGHVYNTLMIANGILDHQVEFLVDKNSKLALEKIASWNYSVNIQSSENILDDIFSINPDVVINDCLDTSSSYMRALSDKGIRTINFEDLGPGAIFANAVINAIYPENEALPNHFFGHDYFLLRDEFVLEPKRPVAEEVSKVLITFGGTDPNNYTKKVLESIYDYCIKAGIEISVITGFGYTRYESIEHFSKVNICRNSSNMATHMGVSDIIFTSAGRTVYEIASLRVPAIVLAQNERELSHFFASEDNGFLNMGLGVNVSHDEILGAFKRLVSSSVQREEMSESMSRSDLLGGRDRVMTLIRKVVEQK